MKKDSNDRNEEISAETLNKGCSCITFDKELLKSNFPTNSLKFHLLENLILTHPTIFSSIAVFLSKANYEIITQVIFTIEKIISSSLYQEQSLNRISGISPFHFGPKGVFMGYDFHISSEGPKLIEINTNAGGALLSLELAKAQQRCCISQDLYHKSTIELSKLESIFIEMFINEWKSQKGNIKMGLVAIVDNEPESQFLYPEFQLFQYLFSEYSIRSIIVAPRDLKWTNGNLTFGNEVVDLVYNRLTDFYFEEEENSDLLSAYKSGSTVFTPSPIHHALYANKLNLIKLSNKHALDKLKVSTKDQEILLKVIPETEEVLKENNLELWSRRKSLFFKPIAGYGSKAAYRGDKITRKVWEHVLNSSYIAQKIVPPGERLVTVDNNKTNLKLDLRAYVFDGKIQLMSSRLYSGQTTNFRTEGGGFAPVFIIP